MSEVEPRPLKSEPNDDSSTETHTARNHPFAEEIAETAPYARRFRGKLE